MDNPFMTEEEKNNVNMEADGNGSLKERSRYVYMDGPRYLSSAVKQVPKVFISSLDAKGLSVGDIDHFVLHSGQLPDY